MAEERGKEGDKVFFLIEKVKADPSSVIKQIKGDVEKASFSVSVQRYLRAMEAYQDKFDSQEYADFKEAAEKRLVELRAEEEKDKDKSQS